MGTAEDQTTQFPPHKIVGSIYKILLGNHAHGDHRIVHDGESVTLGGMTLIAHLTAGHGDCRRAQPLV